MSFFDIFPTPGFLTMATAGVSVTEKGVQFAGFSPSTKKGLVLRNFGEIPLPEGLIKNGFISDERLLSDKLKELREKHGLRFIKATLPEEKAYLFTAEIDKVPYADLEDAVAFTIEENVPVSLEKSIFNFEIIGNPNSETLKIAVTVLPEKVVQAYALAFESAGLTPISFDIESQATSRALVSIGDARSELIINLLEGRTGLYVVEDEVVQFSSTSAFGIKDSMSDVDISNIKGELRKLFGFWNTRIDQKGVPQKKIERIILSGRGASNEDFVAALMNGIEIPYAMANVWTNAFSFKEFLPEVSFADSLEYASAIGAALPARSKMYV